MIRPSAGILVTALSCLLALVLLAAGCGHSSTPQGYDILRSMQRRGELSGLPPAQPPTPSSPAESADR